MAHVSTKLDRRAGGPRSGDHTAIGLRPKRTKKERMARRGMTGWYAAPWRAVCPTWPVLQRIAGPILTRCRKHRVRSATPLAIITPSSSSASYCIKGYASTCHFPRLHHHFGYHHPAFSPLNRPHTTHTPHPHPAVPSSPPSPSQPSHHQTKQSIQPSLTKSLTPLPSRAPNSPSPPRARPP